MIKIFTRKGLEKQASVLYSEETKKITISKMVIGDSNGKLYTPEPSQTTLVNKRAELDLMDVIEVEENIYQFIAKIPSDIEHFIIREVGLIDEDGDLIWVSQCEVESFINIEDVVMENIIGVQIEVTQGTTVTLADENIQMASKDYVNKHFQAISEKGVALGYCPLDEDAFIPSENIRLYTRQSLNSGEESLLYAPGVGTVINPFIQPTLGSNGVFGESDFACISDYGTAYHAFDGNGDTYAGIYGGNTLGCTVTFYNKNPLNITNLVIDGYQNLVRVAYSDDNDSWIQCANVSGSLGSSTVVNITNDIGYHNYYRVSIKNTAGTTNAILHHIHITATEEVLVSTAKTLFFNVGNVYKNLIYTNNAGKTVTKNSMQKIDVSQMRDGVYKIIFPIEGNNSYLYNGEIFKQSKEPEMPSLGDIWINPQDTYSIQKYDGECWQEFEDVISLDSKVVIENGVITTLNQPKYNNNGVCVNQINNPQLIETYENGSSWYRVYSDGWCEQGGYTSKGNEITLPIPMRDSNYGLLLTYSTIGEENILYSVNAFSRTSTSFKLCSESNPVSNTICWQVKGYLAEGEY